MMYKEGWGSTELGGASTGVAAAYGGIKMGSCNQLAPNLRLQVTKSLSQKLILLGPI